MRSAALLLALSLAAPALALDVPLAGRSLSLRARSDAPGTRRLTWKSERSPELAAPLPDPTSGASLELFSSHAPGGCRAEIALPAELWEGRQGDGGARGWIYRDRSGSAGGVRKVRISPGRRGGRIVVRAKGALPCGLEDEQATPFYVALRVGQDRFCSAFGGRVGRNEPGRFRARRAPPLACPDEDVTAASLNVLHGLACPGASERCRLADRVDLLGAWIAERGCPGVIALQEVFSLGEDSLLELVSQRLSGVCPVPYQVIHFEGNRIDDSLLLTRYRPLEAELVQLFGGFRNVLWARLDHPTEPFDVFSTHLASGSDGGSSPCDRFQACAPECVAANAATIRDCQAVQLALLVEDRHDAPGAALVMGDLNEEPGSFVYTAFTGRGWIDTTAAAGVPECDAATGIGCTSGREDEALTDLEAPALGVSERIDFLFLVPPAAGSACAGILDDATDADGDGVATRLFADEPNPFAPACGPLPDPICWVSDHSGTQLDLDCLP